MVRMTVMVLSFGIVSGAGMSACGKNTCILSDADQKFLEAMAASVVEASRVRPGEKVGNIGPNVTGGTLIRPGGRDCYPAFWIRDYAMSLESGLISPEEQRHALLVTAYRQMNTDWPLENGSFVPAGAIPDHIAFDGKPIFYPGTLDDFEGQGGPRWGKLPALDDHFYFILMAAHYVRTTGDAATLQERIRDKTLLERLDWAFRVPPSRKNGQVVFATDDERGVNFGFMDTVIQTGDLLFCSLLKYQAANEMALLYETAGHRPRSREYKTVALALRYEIPSTFATDSGLLRASTGKSGQPDVWGTAYAVYIGLLSGQREQKACKALAQAYRAGTLAWRGNIRHVLTADDFRATTSWDTTDVPRNQYQNGAYWGTPTGWVCYAIAKMDPAAARQLAAEYIAELREGDYRKGPDFGSPWECMHPDGNYRQNPVYMASVTCPLAAFRKITER